MLIIDGADCPKNKESNKKSLKSSKKYGIINKEKLIRGAYHAIYKRRKSKSNYFVSDDT